MNDSLVPTNRIKFVDHAASKNLENENLNNHQFVRFVAIGKRFVNCNFSNSTFEACYLRKCTFDSCNFSGCHFDRCHFPSSSFDGCKFDYATFERTSVDPEILKSSCPGPENLKMRFARTLRTNYQELGNPEAANETILIELSATEIHLRKAAFSRESYYRQKYKGFKRATIATKWFKFKLMDFIWGNGERSLRLIRTIFLALVAMAMFDIFNFRDPLNIKEYLNAFYLAPQVMLGVVAPDEYSAAYLSVVTFLKLVFFALLISIFVKRFQRR